MNVHVNMHMLRELQVFQIFFKKKTFKSAEIARFKLSEEQIMKVNLTGLSNLSMGTKPREGVLLMMVKELL